MAFHFQEALENLLTSKLRSFLAMLGILVGTASVVAMLSVGEMATNMALKQFKRLGTDIYSISISPAKEDKKLFDQFNTEKANTLSKVSHDILIVAPYTMLFQPVRYQDADLQGSLVGATEALQKVIKIEIAKGRFISDFDGFSPYVVIGSALAEKMQADGQSAVGKQIQVGEHLFTVVGVAKHWPENGFFYQDINYSVILPLSLMPELEKNTHINNIIMKINPNANLDQLKEAIHGWIADLLPHSHVNFISPKEIIDAMEKQSRIFTLLLGIIASISLLVGGIGVMNIMLVSIIERRLEIGIRKAIGARESDISAMFLAEALVLTLVGGIIGVIFGEVIALCIALYKSWDFYFYLFPPIIAFVVTVAVGIFFGYYPARKASHLDPIVALRT